MKQSVLLNIKGTQIVDNDEPQNTEIMTPGTLYNKGDYIYVIYSESKLTGMEGTDTTLKLGQDQMTILRRGSVEATQVFIKGYTDQFLYRTTFANFEMRITTKELDIERSNNKINISATFTLEIDNIINSENSLKISIIKR